MSRFDQEVLRSAIEATADDEGRVTPSGVVKAAYDEDNPLHDYFEWRDDVAAHQHRLAVARSLIREVRYQVMDTTNRNVSVVNYLHIPGNQQGYIPLSAASRNRKLSTEIMMSELSRCESAITRARDIADVLELRQELDALLERVIGVRVLVDRKTQKLVTKKAKPKPRGRGRGEHRPNA
jgi:hypothetical protein